MRRFSWMIWLAAACSPGGALSQEVEQGLATLWEVLWHQSGTPTRLVRWENDIRVRLSGVDVVAHRSHTLAALRAVALEAGIKLIDVTDQPELAHNLGVEITPDQGLEDNQPCVTSLDFRTETRIDRALIQMRSRDAWRCAYHEAMHVMGVRGHPTGKTVLSYFPGRVDELLPLDRVMLRAWYSPRMRPGMTPFEALPVLADQLIVTMPDKSAAVRARDLFFMEVVGQMHAYANGQGDVPGVVTRSGKTTAAGIRFGRNEMSFFLGVAYQQGATVAPDPVQAVRWFEHAASGGNRRAEARLGAFR